MKRAIVTGGAGLIGTGICAALLKKGWEVASFDLKEGSSGAMDVLCDISDESAVDEAFSSLGWPQLDLLVNNGGHATSLQLGLKEATMDDWRSTLDSYLTATFLMSRRALPLMPEGSSIVNMASTRAFMSEPGDFIYAAAKGGILSLTQALAMSLGPKVRVNAIAPGWISDGADLSERDHAQHPVGRVGRPADIAEAVLYLSEAGFMTGQTLTIDGGMTRKMIYEE
ncbi:short-chain dehydrogenase/reductase SDR [Pseudovibrio sp. FO-BEG1]|uniref:SDR family NAD(P)-dependent oxidoreductase n=1 Tax=Pseudovibrio sp. (strain FO-BEG1) TaxID=911045 RepID=UPI000238C6D0|nr:SDR family oxidoreductase [Pseudovibrio sp. FO-BEG1]AEV36113.1 short-chain dehydrogenase/reductase SDR [Pseudovibrio sp. FO-BEG1]